jgi:4-hydroxy-tetrahydrodipicolinate reductase
MSDIRVLVNGALGKMGKATTLAVNEADGLVLAGETDLGHDLVEEISKAKADVVVDFTHPSVARENADTILDAGARGVIGTTGFTDEDMTALGEKARSKKLGLVIAPNFAIGVILLMKFAEEAARYLPAVEIIELHHDRKADAPSGTAIATAKRIAAVRAQPPVAPVEENVTVEGARGGRCEGVPVHSVRLRGLLAHQEVLFGGPGQILTLRHDTTDRTAFMPGVVLAVRKVMQLEDLVFGLDKIL